MFFSDNILTKKGGSLGIVWYVTISAGNDHILDYVCRIAANFRPGVHCLSLSRREYCSVSIGKAWYDRWTLCDCCLTLHEEYTLFGYSEEVMSPRNPMALRLSANLMIGIVRIHSQQTHYTYGTTEPHTLMCINRMFLQLSPSMCGRGSRICMTKTGLQTIYQLAPHGNTMH